MNTVKIDANGTEYISVVVKTEEGFKILDSRFGPDRFQTFDSREEAIEAQKQIEKQIEAAIKAAAPAKRREKMNTVKIDANGTEYISLIVKTEEGFKILDSRFNNERFQTFESREEAIEAQKQIEAEITAAATRTD